MRLFFSAWPSPEVVTVIAGLARPEHDAIRWSPPANWHVTLLFVGEVDDAAPLVAALDTAADRCRRVVATLGPALEDLGGHLVAPVAGLDDLAAAIREELPGEDRPFRGHLTVARSRRRQAVPPELLGRPIHARWTVDELTLVRSHLGAGGSTYEILAAAPLR